MHIRLAFGSGINFLQLIKRECHERKKPNFIDKNYQKTIMEFILKLKCAKIITTHNTEMLEKHFSKVIHFGKSNAILTT